ncbi:MAG TPA: universal stress protein [Nitrolancea sp.]|nr:universal stress protein [Nitrolancea sp.]
MSAGANDRQMPAVKTSSAPFTIAAVLPEPATALQALWGMEALARQLPAARLVAAHVQVDPHRYAADQEEIDLQLLRTRTEGSPTERATAIRRVFDTWARSAGTIGQRTMWHETIGAEETAISAFAAEVDLIVLARPQNLDSRDAFHAAIFSHRLVLVIPETRSSASSFCQHIAVGWNQAKEVDHVVLQALPVLRLAERVTLISIDDGNPDPVHDYMMRALEEVGVRPELRTVRTNNSIARTLVDEAHKIGAQALVMGAYRHGQIWEQIVGGITREVVRTSPIPVFLAH